MWTPPWGVYTTTSNAGRCSFLLARSETRSMFCPSLCQSTMDVIDLFCGCGGFSSGALQAGATISLAIEADPHVARIYARNFDHAPRVETLGEVEPLAQEIIARFDLNRTHVHGSPPCVRLSQVNKTNPDVDAGLELVRFFLDLVQRVQPRSWSMEQVSHPAVRKELTERGVAFTVVNAVDFGLPQNRVRVIAGSQRIVSALEQCKGTGPTLLPKDVLTSLQPSRYKLTSGTSNQPIKVRRGGKNVTVGHRPMREDEGARDLHTPCHTVYSKPGGVFDCQTASRTRKLTPGECASLQGFGTEFVLGNSMQRSYRVVGNAIPPPLARAIMSTAVSGR